MPQGSNYVTHTSKSYRSSFTRVPCLMDLYIYTLLKERRQLKIGLCIAIKKGTTLYKHITYSNRGINIYIATREDNLTSIYAVQIKNTFCTHI